MGLAFAVAAAEVMSGTAGAVLVTAVVLGTLAAEALALGPRPGVPARPGAAHARLAARGRRLMRRALALVLLIAVCGVVLALGGGARPTAALAFGFALIAAALVGDLFERLRLPRLTGYLAFGIACGPFAADLISSPMARELRIVNGLAIALIAFVAGLEINVARLRPKLPAFARFGAVLIGTMFALLFVAAWAAWPWLPILPDAQGPLRIALAALLATLVVSFSPTVTIAVLADARARGPLSELVVALVVLGDLAIIVAFTLVMPLVRWTLGGSAGGGAGDAHLAARLAWDIGGSLAFGAMLGGVFAIYLRLVAREVTLVLLALCAVASRAARPSTSSRCWWRWRRGWSSRTSPPSPATRCGTRSSTARCRSSWCSSPRPGRPCSWTPWPRSG